MRGCGSKHGKTAIGFLSPRVAPMRGCGSKPDRARRYGPGPQSPPCGGVDRNLQVLAFAAQHYGRPHAGVWIETGQGGRDRGQASGSPPCGGVDRNPVGAGSISPAIVAPMRGCGSKLWRDAGTRCTRRSPPCGGVDRNSQRMLSWASDRWSPPCGGVDRNSSTRLSPVMTTVAPMRGCGSKLGHRSFRARRRPGRPHAGVWIETVYDDHYSNALAVAPMRGCGSKQARLNGVPDIEPSPPCGGVDRNIVPITHAGGIRGRPHAGVWIETTSPPPAARPSSVAPMRGCGSKLRSGCTIVPVAPSPPCGGVDRNTGSEPSRPTPPSRPHAGVWIETPAALPPMRSTAVAPMRGCGSKLHGRSRQPIAHKVAPMRGCGSKPRSREAAPLARRSPPCGGVDRNCNENFL